MRTTWIAAGVFILTAGSYAGSARAAQPDETRAEERFREGERLYEAKDFRGAALALQDSQRLDPQLGTLINLALCHEALGHVATAIQQFEIAATWAAARKQVEREQYARQHAADLSKHASVVHLSLPDNSRDYAIALDGEPIAPSRWAMPIFVDAGGHSVHVSAPGMQSIELPLVIALGPSDQTLAIPALVPERKPLQVPAPPAPAPEEGGDTRRPLGLVAGGVGVVALSLASYLVARDGKPSAEAIAAGAAGGIVLGGGAWLFFSAGPSAPAPHASVGGQCATIGVATTW
jgi:hypothetical protein